MRITDTQIAQLREQGFLIVHNFLSPAETDAARTAFYRDFSPPLQQWLDAGKPKAHGSWLFPFIDNALNFTGTHPDVIDAAERIIGTRDIRMGEFHLGIKYSTESYWGGIHIDYGNNTLGPEPAEGDLSHLAVFFCYDDVKEGQAPIMMVPKGRPDSEAVPMICRAGSICFYGMGTRHTASKWTGEPGQRPTSWVSFVRADRPWDAARTFTYKSGADFENMKRWMAAASPRQRELIGFPPPGDPLWTDAFIDGMVRRYGIDPTPYRKR